MRQALQLIALFIAIVVFAQDAPVKYPHPSEPNAGSPGTPYPRPPVKGSGSAPASTSQASTQPPAANDPADNGKDQKEPTYKVDVKLVNVYVTVQDQHGSPVAGLTKDNFKLSGRWHSAEHCRLRARVGAAAFDSALDRRQPEHEEGHASGTGIGAQVRA